MHVTLRLADEEFDLYLVRENGTVKVEIDGETLDVKVLRDGPHGVELEVAGERFTVKLGDDHAIVDGEGLPLRITEFRPVGAPGAHGPARGQGARGKPPQPRKGVAVKVKVGDEVKPGDVLLILEAMKMQNEIPSPTAGVVKAIHVKPGQTVEGKDLLLEIE